MRNAEKYELNKQKRKKEVSFKHLKPVKVGDFYELKFNERLYRNTSKKNLISDIETIESYG